MQLNKTNTIIELSDTKSLQFLCDKIVELYELGFRNYQLTNKTKGNNLEIWNELKKLLGEKYSDINWTLNYSIGNNYNNGIGVIDKFENFLEEVFSTKTFLHQKNNIPQVLLISGSAVRKIDSVNVWEGVKRKVAEEWSLTPSARNYSLFTTTTPKFSVAFNPFLSVQDLILEKERLSKKIATGLVDTIYLQIGIDLDAMKKGVEFVRTLEKEFGVSLNIIISVLIPSQSLLNSWNLRPWKGVFLDKDYLGSIIEAQNISLEILSYCESENLQVLLTVFDWEFLTK
jgi:hypothetical protein